MKCGSKFLRVKWLVASQLYILSNRKLPRQRTFAYVFAKCCCYNVLTAEIFCWVARILANENFYLHLYYICSLHCNGIFSLFLFSLLSFNSISTGFCTKQSKCTSQNWLQSRRMQRLPDLCFTILVSSRNELMIFI